MKWLTTLILLETDGRIRQKHLLPLDLMNENQKSLLLDMMKGMVEVGLSGISDPKHEIRFKMWTHVLPQGTEPEPWDKSMSLPSCETDSSTLFKSSETTATQPEPVTPECGNVSPKPESTKPEPSNPVASKSKRPRRGSGER